MQNCETTTKGITFAQGKQKSHDCINRSRKGI